MHRLMKKVAFWDTLMYTVQVFLSSHKKRLLFFKAALTPRRKKHLAPYGSDYPALIE